MSNEDGKIQIHAPIKPLNENPRGFVTENKYVKGADQTFQSITELINFHPDRMEQGMVVRVMNYPTIGTISEYFLNTSPANLLDSNRDSIVTAENFTTYWGLTTENNSGQVTIQEYAPSGPNGEAPAFPYTLATEATAGWTPTYDASKNHKWVRFRTDDVDSNSDGIFDNWSIPVPIGSQYEQNDYIENRFIRQDVDLTVRTNSSGFVVNSYYIILSGTITINGTERTAGYVFEHLAPNTYVFNSAEAQETVPAPPRTLPDGNPNNEPTGYSDTIPAGSEMLWIIEAQKNVYGQLKSDWIIRRIIENPNYIRYSSKSTPNPNTLVGINDSAATGQQGDTDLENAGWSSVYSDQDFIATREDDNGGSAGPPFTQWRIDKINQESGEFKDFVFKLYDFNIPIGSPLLVAPTNADPTDEGWSDTPQPETSQKKNYVSSATKFVDGTLKTAWSDPTPYTAFPAYQLNVESDNDDDFKTDKDGNIVPATITLTAEIFKSTEKLWEDGAVGLAFQWKRVYNNGAVVDETADTDTGDDFFILGSTGTAGQPGYLHSGQRLTVKPSGVDGKAVFRCTITVTMEEGDDIVASIDYSILDVSDGLDAKNIEIGVDSQTVIYDTTNTVHIPAAVTLTAFFSNIGNPTLYWYEWNGASWDALSTGGAYTVNGNRLVLDTSVLFAADGTAEEKRYAVSTDDTNPDSADGDTIHSDFKTIAKLGSTGVGAPGEDAIIGILDNETATIVLDSSTGSPVLNEIGATGRIITKLEVYEGTTKLIFGGGNDYTVAVAPTSGDIQFGVQADGDDARIFVSQWNSTTERSATCTITITYGAIVFQKKFQVASTLDAPGALILDVDSDRGLAFTPDDRADKTLTASLYDTNQDPELQTSGFEYNFQIAGVFLGWTTSRTQVVTRADINTSSVVVVQVRPTGGSVVRTRTINMYDIIDVKTIRMFTASDPVTSANKIPASQTDDSTVTVSGVTWRSIDNAFWDTNEPVYAIDGEEDPNNINQFIWSNPYRIKGESGSQGPAGGFFHMMYKQNGTSLPSGTGDTSTLSQMTADGWASRPPLTDNVYMTFRPWQGEGNTFDGNGNPSADPIVGTTWSTPVVFTGPTANDGNDGDDGDPGDTGWSPVFSVITSGNRRVLQLDDWIGGTGSKPGNVGSYVGSSGFVTNINNAVDIRGATGADGSDGASIQPVYRTLNLTQSSGGNAYRKYLSINGSTILNGLPSGTKVRIEVELDLIYVSSSYTEVNIGGWVIKTTGTDVTEDFCFRTVGIDGAYNQPDLWPAGVPPGGTGTNVNRHKFTMTLDVISSNTYQIWAAIRLGQVSNSFKIQKANAIFIPLDD